MQMPTGSNQQSDEPQNRKTPASDMQAEDAGSAGSGNDKPAPGTESEAAMKQTSKTEAERSGKR